ncbi:MAG: hypothetical protein MPI95_03250 [Nitrosopumilus sp.]|nr:hypothetical protein [Nitrosopumilus sp.]MDA7958093.1 hypothetical protein [Nitrosopumilus sp.]
MLVPAVAVLLVLAVPAAHASLQDVIVEWEVSPGVTEPGGPVTVHGRALDHGYDPLEGAEITVRIGGITESIRTNSSGGFEARFEGGWQVPATYVVNLVASSGDGASIYEGRFRVAGSLDGTNELRAALSTPAAARYLAANASDFERDPIGARLFEYYDSMRRDLEEKVAGMAPTTRDLQAEQSRGIAERLRQEAVEESERRAGTADAESYRWNLEMAHPEVRELVEGQFNFTRGVLDGARDARDAVIASGGTSEQAEDAYWEALKVPREALEEFNRNATGGNPPGTGTP